MRKELEGRVVDFLKSLDQKFLTACEKVNIKPSRRQASKWLNKKGKAWNTVGKFQ